MKFFITLSRLTELLVIFENFYIKYFNDTFCEFFG